MERKKAVAISDAHLGQTGEDGIGYFSLLSSRCNDVKAKQKRKKFIQEVKDFVGSDPLTLIGVGDILDLSFSYIRNATVELVDLLRDLQADRFVYIIGNHDHFIWTAECVDRNVVAPMMKGYLPAAGTVYKPDQGNFSTLLENMLARQLGYKPTTITAYPTFYDPEINTTFTHGHLFGGMYTYMSDILGPFLKEAEVLTKYEKIAATVNMPLNQFIYWLLGETGEGMGAEGVMEAVFADMKRGKKAELIKAIDSAVDVLLPNGLIKGIPDSWERKMIKWICRRIASHYIKDPKPISSLDRHMPSKNSRIKAEEWMKRTENTAPRLVFGHTHVSDAFITESGLEIINLGGWLIEPNEPEPDAAALFIDGDKVELRKI